MVELWDWDKFSPDDFMYVHITMCIVINIFLKLEAECSFPWLPYHQKSGILIGKKKCGDVNPNLH